MLAGVLAPRERARGGHVSASSADGKPLSPRFLSESLGKQVAISQRGLVAIIRRAFRILEGVDMFGTAFGISTPFGYPTPQLNPYGQPFSGAQGAPNPQITQALQQAVQLLQFVPQQLQQLQQLQYVQHQQLQQLLQAIPSQLAQLQQLIQFIPHQIQQLQQSAPFQQPFGQSAGTTGYGISTPWGIAPPSLGSQPSHVM
jgi:hypothetical protein